MSPKESRFCVAAVSGCVKDAPREPANPRADMSPQAEAEIRSELAVMEAKLATAEADALICHRRIAQLRLILEADQTATRDSPRLRVV